MLKKLLIASLLICCAATAGFAQKKKAKRASRGDKLITALIDAEEVRGMFGDDAMSPFTGSPEIQAIFALGKKSIPLLIAHLDDKRLLGVSTSEATFQETKEFTVTIGAACFDLLTYVIREDARFFDQGCIKDLSEGHISSCAKEKYAIFPEDFWSGVTEVKKDLWHGKNLVVSNRVRKAKRNWQAAYRKGQIYYVKFDDGTAQ